MTMTSTIHTRPEPVARKQFNAPIVREHSSSPRPTPLGTSQCTMELFLHDGSAASGWIQWDMADVDEYVEIGLTFDAGTRTLTDYDGVFSLPQQAIEMLTEYGFNVPENMR